MSMSDVHTLERKMVTVVSLVSFFVQLVNSPLTRFKDGVKTFRQHSKNAYHVHSVRYANIHADHD